MCAYILLIVQYTCSIHGENKHFGTPTNPAAPDRVPGGCSSGSAVAVAAGIVDFSLGELTILIHCLEIYACNMLSLFGQHFV